MKNYEEKLQLFAPQRYETSKDTIKKIENCSRSLAMRIAREKKVRYDIALPAVMCAELTRRLSEILDVVPKEEHGAYIETGNELAVEIQKKYPAIQKDYFMFTKLMGAISGFNLKTPDGKRYLTDDEIKAMNKRN